jgi:hypothetical protein
VELAVELAHGGDAVIAPDDPESLPPVDSREGDVPVPDTPVFTVGDIVVCTALAEPPEINEPVDVADGIVVLVQDAL